MTSTQQKVWALVQEENIEKFLSASNDTLVHTALLNNQSTRLLILMKRQREERQQMQERHKQEIALSYQIAENPDEISN